MHLKHIAAGLIAVGCLTTVVKGQKSFWDSSQAYLGQTRPSDTPQIFAPDLLTDPGTSMWNVGDVAHHTVLDLECGGGCADVKDLVNHLHKFRKIKGTVVQSAWETETVVD